MSVLTVALFIVSVCVFITLLSSVIYLLLTQGPLNSDSEVQGAEGLTIGTQVFNCEVEVVVLEDHVQITNTDEQQIRMDGSGLGRGLRLVTEDQLQLNLQPEENLYRLYSMGSGDDDDDDKQFLQVKVAPEFIEVKPVLKHIKQRLEIIIWKMKPYSLRSEPQLAERQVFCGYLQKTVHFDRAPGKYFRFLVTTNGPNNRLASYFSQSNVTMAPSLPRRHRLLTLRVQPDRVAAVNQSNLPILLVVRHRSETLKRRLGRELQDLPPNGTFSFSLLHSSGPRGGGGIQKVRKALRVHLTDRQLTVEPHTRFGCLPLSCDVVLPPSGTGRNGDAPTQVVAGEFLSALQLPRGSHRYVMSFFMHMQGDLDATEEAVQGPALQRARRAN